MKRLLAHSNYTDGMYHLELIKELEEAGEYPLRNIEGYW